jgi:hypothetical protein
MTETPQDCPWCDSKIVVEAGKPVCVDTSCWWGLEELVEKTVESKRWVVTN